VGASLIVWLREMGVVGFCLSFDTVALFLILVDYRVR